MSAKHTPGPWKFFPHVVFDGEFVVGPREFHSVAHIRAGNDLDDCPAQTPANARLIAAAPCLLDALEEAEKCLAESEYSNGYAIKIIRAAITKAKGESNE